MSAQRFVPRCFFLLFVLAPVLWAQSSQWQNLAQIKPGTKVQVVENSLKSTSGKFVGFSETDLTLKVEDKEVVILKDQVHRVSISGKNRKRNTLIGLAVGVGTGAAVGAAANRVVGEAWVVPGMMLGYAGLGAGIGALVPAAKTVYSAEVPKQAGPKEQSVRERR